VNRRGAQEKKRKENSHSGHLTWEGRGLELLYLRGNGHGQMNLTGYDSGKKTLSSRPRVGCFLRTCGSITSIRFQELLRLLVKNKTGPAGCAGPVWFAADLELAPV
jgi:hypothetical protein